MFISISVLVVFCACFFHWSLGQEVVISSPPKNVTAQTGSFAYLNCETETKYSEAFAWRFVGSSPAGETVYITPPYKPFSKFPSSRFQKVGEFGLNITSLQWQDGGTYDCSFLSGDVHGFADVIVLDTPQTNISPSVVNLGDVVTMTCSVTFGGPQNDPTYVMPDQFPQLSMMLGQENFNTHAPLNYTPGYPVRAQHRMIRSIMYTVTAADRNKHLQCSVSTRNPLFTLSSSAVLNIRMPVRDVIISPDRSQYVVNDIINCTADGYPSPTVKWVAVNSSSSVKETGASLFIDKDMGGYNVWNCVAYNELNSQPVTTKISFTVGDKVMIQDSGTKGANVGLAVGLVIGIAVLIITIVLIVVLVTRYRRQHRKHEEKKETVHEEPLIYRPNAGSRSSNSAGDEGNKPRPVAKPRAASVNKTLDTSASGFADLGTSGISASTDSLHKILDSDSGKSKPVEKPRPKANARGSTESLDKSLDSGGRPVPKERPKSNFRGSTESLDKSIESRPQPKERPRPNTRASNESLDRSVESDVKPRPATAPKPAKKPDV